MDDKIKVHLAALAAWADQHEKTNPGRTEQFRAHIAALEGTAGQLSAEADYLTGD